MNNLLISKSKYLNGLQCHKLLWFYYNDKEKIPQPDQTTRAKFEQGKLVGEFAKKLFPNGIQIDGDPENFSELISASSSALKHRKPIFEGAFKVKNAFARVDVLNPFNGDQWDIIEVKSSTEVKDEHIPDLAIQRYICEEAGLKIRKCYIMHVNNQYIRRGEIDPKELLTQVDITDRVSEWLPQVEQHLHEMITTINRDKHPEIAIGVYCDKPYPCPLHEMCWAFLPEDHILTLNRFSKKQGFDLINKGILDVRNIPTGLKLNDKQQRQLIAIRSSQPYIDKGAIRDFLKTMEFPIYFVDFETFDTAIPIFNLTRPYEKVPFQYSLHVLQSQDGQPDHYSFLADGSVDPRPEIMTQLQRNLGSNGTIIAYNLSFEKTILKYILESYPEYSDWYAQIEPRFVDLLKPFSSFDYYHPLQRGTASIKAVLPALTGSGYEGMEISEGETASLEYLRVTFGRVTEEERIRVRQQLEEYCQLDTLAMVRILEKLWELAT